MDMFKTLDKSGRGVVDLEDFVITVTEKLCSLCKDTELLCTVAAEVLKIENRASELAARLQKDASGKLHSQLACLTYLICDRLRNIKSPVRVNLSNEMLVE